jgi:hypothetical protein
MIGPLLGAIPAALVALSLGPDKLVWVIVATVIIQQLEIAAGLRIMACPKKPDMRMVSTRGSCCSRNVKP